MIKVINYPDKIPFKVSQQFPNQRLGITHWLPVGPRAYLDAMAFKLLGRCPQRLAGKFPSRRSRKGRKL